MTIHELVEQAIAAGEPLRIETRDGVEGVLIADREEFIAWEALGYSSELGFFDINEFPFMENEAA